MFEAVLRAELVQALQQLRLLLQQLQHLLVMQAMPQVTHLQQQLKY